MYRKEIEEYIDSHKNQMIEDICTLCRINSEKMPYTEGKPFGEGPFEVLQTALTMMENYGFSVRNYDNYVGTADLNDKEAQLDILAHLDIVPAGEGWTVTEPFEPVIKDGKLYGRGTADDKGPAVAALYAMRAVKELGIPVKKNVRLILGTDEECGSSDIAVYYKQEKEAPMTFSPDAEFPVINVEKGRLPGHFVASFEKSDAMPKLVKIDAGLKSNVVPGKAKAVVAGVEDAVLNETAAAVTKETEVTFTFTGCEEGVLITAEGEGAHASTPEEGKNALTALLMLITKLPLASCPQMDAVKSLVKLFPHGDTRGKALGVAMSDEVSGELTIAFDLLHVDAESLDGTFDCRAPICANDENALKVAKWLKNNDKVAWVNYPGLEGDKYYDLAQKYMPNGTCGVLTFGIKGGREASIKFMDNLKFVAIVTHVADARSCVLHPASHTHRQMTDEQLIEAGVQPDLIRFSVGIEDAEDIIADLDQALNA